MKLVASLYFYDATMTVVLSRMIIIFLLFRVGLEFVGANVRYLDVFDSARLQDRGNRSNQTRIECTSVSLHMCVCVREWLNTYVRLNVGLTTFFCVDVDLPQAAIYNVMGNVMRGTRCLCVALEACVCACAHPK